MVKKRSKQNNPEQKTRNGINNQDVELGQDYDPMKQSKKKYEQSHLYLIGLGYCYGTFRL